MSALLLMPSPHLSSDDVPDALHDPASTDGWSGVELTELDPIDLSSLVAAGNLQTRVDRKYLIPAAAMPELVGAIAPLARCLEIESARVFCYRTVYFDTPELTSYLAATRRRAHRFKVRTRTYLDSGEQWLEAKTKDGRGRTVKTRQVRYDEPADVLFEDDDQFLAEALTGSASDPDEAIARLRPTLTTQYQRATLLLPADGARVTLDTDLTAVEPSGREVRAPAVAILETKSTHGASAMDRLLWQRGHRPLKVSKFATCLAALHPELPAHKWRPALRRLGANVTRHGAARPGTDPGIPPASTPDIRSDIRRDTRSDFRPDDRLRSLR